MTQAAWLLITLVYLGQGPATYPPDEPYPTAQACQQALTTRAVAWGLGHYAATYRITMYCKEQPLP